MAAIADATTVTESGYVGDDVENLITKLLFNCIPSSTSGSIFLLFIISCFCFYVQYY